MRESGVTTGLRAVEEAEAGVLAVISKGSRGAGLMRSATEERTPEATVMVTTEERVHGEHPGDKG